MKGSLLILIFVLLLTFQTLNSQLYNGTENKTSMGIGSLNNVREGKINHNNSREVYRDGIIDPFDNFTNTGFPTEYKRSCFRDDPCQIMGMHAN